MTQVQLHDATRRPPTIAATPAIRSFLRSRRGMLVLAAAVLATGAAFNWSWLVAAGIAPLLIGVLPCLAMCAFGLCMMGRSCAKGSASVDAGAQEPARGREPAASVPSSPWRRPDTARVGEPAAVSRRPGAAPPLVIDGGSDVIGVSVLTTTGGDASMTPAQAAVTRSRPERRLEDA